MKGLKGQWPPLLGINEVTLSEQGETLISIPKEAGEHPLLVVGKYGEGKTMVWTSDIGPHWVSKKFLSWEGYKTLWNQILEWLVENN